MNNVVNWDLLTHPANWVIIFLTLYLVALLARILYSAAATGTHPFAIPSLSD